MTVTKGNIERIIIGVDPGTQYMGFGVLLVSGKTVKPIDLGMININKEHSDAYLKLKYIFESTISLIDKHLPDELAIETQFFGKNVQSMLKLGRAQGIVIAAALTRNIPVFEYQPKLIKQSVCGNGNASKEQVAAMLHHLLKIDISTGFDATDAMAVAMCHYLKSGFVTEAKSTTIKKTKNWGDFIKNNPQRVSGE